MVVDSLSQQLINRYQRGFPLTAKPFLQLAQDLGVTESEVLERMQMLKDSGILSRLGPVFDHKQAGASTLAALAVPPHKLGEVAHTVNEFDQVNHNYAREHHYNLWFVATAPDQPLLDQCISEIKLATGFSPLVLPMIKDYHIDLSFDIDFEEPSHGQV